MNTADMLVHVHPNLDAQARSNLERDIMSHIGVDCAAFMHQPQPHSLMVKYDPDTIKGMDILREVRHIDPAATMVGL